MPNSEETSHDDNRVLGECSLAADKILSICHELDIKYHGFDLENVLHLQKLS